MKIIYRKHDEFNPIDIEKLRPNRSYDYLIGNRTHTITGLIEKFNKIPDELLKIRECPVCRSQKYQPVMEKDYLKIVKCDGCALVYVNPIFNEEHYKDAYSSTDYQNIVRNIGEQSHEYRLERFGRERVGILSEHIQKSDSQINFLDIGCSTGFVVEAAKEHKWRAIGIDLNPSAIEFGKSRGLDLYNCALEDFDPKGVKFDAIALFDVLEHLANPSEILKQVITLLKDDGLVFIYVPNWDSASRMFMGKDAHFIWPTHHLNYFTPQTLVEFITSFNLETEYLVTEGLDLVDYIWYREKNGLDAELLKELGDKLQFFINAGGYGKNLRLIGKKRS